jgi:hypothetical protein
MYRAAAALLDSVRARQLSRACAPARKQKTLRLLSPDIDGTVVSESGSQTMQLSIDKVRSAPVPRQLAAALTTPARSLARSQIGSGYVLRCQLLPVVNPVSVFADTIPFQISLGLITEITFGVRTRTRTRARRSLARSLATDNCARRCNLCLPSRASRGRSNRRLCCSTGVRVARRRR